MAIARTLYEKIVESHTVKRIDGETVLLYVDAHFANEYTSPQAFSGVRERGCGVFAPDSHLCVVDHIIPSADTNPRVIHDEAKQRPYQPYKSGEGHNIWILKEDGEIKELSVVSDIVSAIVHGKLKEDKKAFFPVK